MNFLVTIKLSSIFFYKVQISTNCKFVLSVALTRTDTILLIVREITPHNCKGNNSYKKMRKRINLESNRERAKGQLACISIL